MPMITPIVVSCVLAVMLSVFWLVLWARAHYLLEKAWRREANYTTMIAGLASDVASRSTWGPLTFRLDATDTNDWPVLRYTPFDTLDYVRPMNRAPVVSFAAGPAGVVMLCADHSVFLLSGAPEHPHETWRIVELHRG